MRRLLIASTVLCLLAVTGLASIIAVVFGDDTSNRTRVARMPLELSAVDHKFLYDEWNKQVSSETFWRGRRGQSPSAALAQPPSRLQGPPANNSWFVAPPSNPWMIDQPGAGGSRSSIPQGRGGSGYRTVCVRTCDGYFFPISASTSESRFSRDQATCSTACPGARLFYYRASNGTPDDMVDTNGQSYSKMANANLFRTQYVESCKCKPNPWEQEAVDRHRIYALEHQRQRGNRDVVAELRDLRGKQQVEAATRPGARRSQDRNRRRPTESDDRTSLPVPMSTVSQSAPRSDATRGQSDRKWTNAATDSPAAPASDAPQTGRDAALSKQPTRTASVAPNRATVIDAPIMLANASADVVMPSAIASAATAAADVAPPVAAKVINGPALTQPVAGEPASDGGPTGENTAADPAVTGSLTATAPQASGPEATPPSTTKRSRRDVAARRAARPGVAARPSRPAQPGANSPQVRQAALRPARDSNWVSRAFGM